MRVVVDDHERRFHLPVDAMTAVQVVLHDGKVGESKCGVVEACARGIKPCAVCWPREVES